MKRFMSLALFFLAASCGVDAPSQSFIDACRTDVAYCCSESRCGPHCDRPGLCGCAVAGCAAGLVCDPASTTCVACLTDLNCVAAAGGPRCAPSHRCVQCLGPTDCVAAAPICEAEVCRGCSAHSECPGGLCALDGTCPADTETVWVQLRAAAGCPGAGTMADPYCQIQTALDAGARYVAVMDSTTGNPYGPISLTMGEAVEIHAVETGATILQTTGGGRAVFCDGSTLALHGIDVSGIAATAEGVFATNCTLTLQDLSIDGNGTIGLSASAGSTTLNSVQITNNGTIGLSAMGGADVTITRCWVEGNSGGGLDLSNARFTVENTFVVAGNGTATSAWAGVNIGTPLAGSIFANNTVVGNFASAGGTGGVFCGAAFPLINSLIANNGGAEASVTCTRASDTYVSDAAVPLGGTDGYHLMVGASTCCIDMGTATGAPTDDYDGEARPCPAGGAVDIGADELCP